MASPGPSNTATYTPLPQDDQMMFAPPQPARPDNDDGSSPEKPIKVRLHLLLAARIVFLTLSLPVLVFIVMSYQLPDAAVVRVANDPLGQIHSVTTGTHVKIVPLTSVILAFLGVTMAWNVLQFIPTSTHGSTKIHPCCFSIQCYLSDGDEDDKKPVQTRTLIMLVDFLLGLTILLLALGGVLFWQKSWKLNRMTMLCFTIYTAVAQLGVAAFSRCKISRLAIAFLYLDEDSLSDTRNTGTIRLADDE